MREFIDKQSNSNVEKISILMPAFNAEKYISKAIDSVLLQTCKNWELIIIDDASTDDTWNVINSYHDERITKKRKNDNCNWFINKKEHYETNN